MTCQQCGCWMRCDVGDHTTLYYCPGCGLEIRIGDETDPGPNEYPIRPPDEARPVILE